MYVKVLGQRSTRPRAAAIAWLTVAAMFVLNSRPNPPCLADVTDYVIDYVTDYVVYGGYQKVAPLAQRPRLPRCRARLYRPTRARSRPAVAAIRFLVSWSIENARFAVENA